MIFNSLFFLACLFEIGGGYLVWPWSSRSYSWFFGTLGGFILFLSRVNQPFQNTTFHRTYAAYSGIFIVTAIIWGLIDKKSPDRFEIIDGVVVLLGALVIFMRLVSDRLIKIHDKELAY